MMRSLHGSPIRTVSTAIEPPLSEAAAEAWIPRTCFKNGPPSRIGVELELLVIDARHPDGPGAHYPRHRYPNLLRELSGGHLDGALTVEPGGQVELSSHPGPTLAHTLAEVHRDLAALRRRAARRGALLLGMGVDPIRGPRRLSDHPRYVAMEHYFDAWGPAGRTMMCSTASVQVNVEAGVHPPVPGPSDAHAPLLGVTERWDLLHAIGPALVAAFANSPCRAGRSTGWKSTRQGVWLDLDPARTGLVAPRPGEDLESAWTRWVLDAPLLLVRREHGPWTAPPGVSFRGWIRHGRRAVTDRPQPSLDDLSYHMTTLFPQVRPRGHFEVRFIDAQPGPWWTVPPAVIAALLDDRWAGQQAREACGGTEGRWRDAARTGMDDPALARAAVAVLTTAAEALQRVPDNTLLARQVGGYLERWTARGRCPADDPLDAGLTGPHIASIDGKGAERPVNSYQQELDDDRVKKPGPR